MSPSPPDGLDGYADPGHLDPAAFEALVTTPTTAQQAPGAREIVSGVPVYEAADLEAAADDPHRRRELASGIAHCLRDGPGVLVVRGAVGDVAAVDALTQAFSRIADRERERRLASDHFATPGANTRIWNALAKSAVEAPDAWVRYHASATLDLVAEAWLGPHHLLTAQVNIVHPGGESQLPHRDYHLGFWTEQAPRFPRHTHFVSRFLTLQGAIAHTPMDLESGPTRVLPHSQRFLDGYVAWRDPRFVEIFRAHAVQLPLAVGDALFFDPALVHAAGANRGDRDRVANLYQVSSVFGVPMESVDRDGLALTVYPALLEAVDTGLIDRAAARRVVDAAADPQPFPTDLDADPPVGSMTPLSGTAVLHRALGERWSVDRLRDELARRRRARGPRPLP